MYIGAWQEYKMYRLMLLEEKYKYMCDFPRKMVSPKSKDSNSELSFKSEKFSIKTEISNRNNSLPKKERNNESIKSVSQKSTQQSENLFRPSIILKDKVNFLTKMDVEINKKVESTTHSIMKKPPLPKKHRKIIPARIPGQSHPRNCSAHVERIRKMKELYGLNKNKLLKEIPNINKNKMASTNLEPITIVKQPSPGNYMNDFHKEILPIVDKKSEDVDKLLEWAKNLPDEIENSNSFKQIKK